MSVQTGRHHPCISSLVSMDSAFCSGVAFLYSPPFLRNRTYSMSFFTIAPGWYGFP